MTFALPLGWTGTFDQDDAVLHLSTGDGTRAAAVTFGPSPAASGDGALDRVTSLLESDIYWRGHNRWKESRGRVPVGATALLETRSAGSGQLVNGDITGLRRSRRTGTVTLAGRTWTVRHRTRWRTVVEVEGQRVAVLSRRVFSRRKRPLDRTAPPRVETSAITEVDQLVVVLAAVVMGPPGRTGFWGELGGEFVSSV